MTGALPLPEGSWWDWEVLGWDAGSFRLAAGYDLTYRHGLEVIFHEPLLVSCPTDFQDPEFRAPTPAELTYVSERFGEPPGTLVAFAADAGGRRPVGCLIAAARVEFRTDPPAASRPPRQNPARPAREDEPGG